MVFSLRTPLGLGGHLFDVYTASQGSEKAGILHPQPFSGFLEGPMKRHVIFFLTVIILWLHVIPIFTPDEDFPALSSSLPTAYCLLPTLTLLAPPIHAASEDPYRSQRAGMVSAVEDDLRLTSARVGKKALSQCVLDAMLNVPRHEFVPVHLKRNAYENRPLPIGYGQTISQPYIVGIMTELLDVSRESVVLEVGTGSGYQAAILAHCVKQVYTIEIIGELGEEARPRLKRLGYENVEVRIGDGYYGWKEHAPFDAIIVTAAAGNVPHPLIEQLKPTGKMVIPVGGPFMTQYLMLVEKGSDGKITTKQLLPVAFVPLTGGH
jgi:protein-L-isoaspartate(D-aspartate) O-methyltransferase